MKRRPKRIKSMSRENRFKRLRSCDCFPEVNDRMLAGWPLDQLARFIQVDNSELADLAAASLVTMLREYRKTIPPGDFVSQTPPADIVEQRMRPYHEEALKKMAEGLSELSEIERLYRRQMGRIEIDTEVEKRQKKLIPSMTQEIRVAQELLMNSAKLKMDLGLKKRHLGVMETEARLLKDVNEKYGSAQITEAVKDSQSRRRLSGVVAAFERFMLSEGESENGQMHDSILEDLKDVLPEDPEEHAFQEHVGYAEKENEQTPPETES